LTSHKRKVFKAVCEILIILNRNIAFSSEIPTVANKFFGMYNKNKKKIKIKKFKHAFTGIQTQKLTETTTTH